MSNAAEENKKFVPVLRVVLNQALDGAEQFLTDAEGATWGLTINDTGVNSTVMSEFGAKTPFGSRIATIKNSDQHMLAGLAQGQYLFFGGAALDPKATGQILDDVLNPAIAELEKIEDAAAIVKYLNAMKAYQTAQTGQSFGWVAPTGAIGQESLMQIVAVATGDAKKMAQAQREMFESQQAVMKLFGGEADAQVTTTYTANAKEVDGVKFDLMQTKFNLDPQTPQEAQAAADVDDPLRPRGDERVPGHHRQQALLAVIGGGDVLLSKAIPAAKKGDVPLASLPGVKAVAAKLPQNRIVAVYVPLDEIARTGLNYAKQFGFPLNVQLPPNLPPIGTTVAAEGAAVRIDTHIPTQLVQSLVAAGMQAWMGMQQGEGQPGGL